MPYWAVSTNQYGVVSGKPGSFGFENKLNKTPKNEPEGKTNNIASEKNTGNSVKKEVR